MIPLFHIPRYKIDTADFGNLLHDKIVREFEQQFADYAGAKYAVSFNSATSAIFIIFRHIVSSTVNAVAIPSVIPPVVPNALINAGKRIQFTDDTEWVGKTYQFYNHADIPCFPIFGEQKPVAQIVDSAQAVYPGQYINMKLDGPDMMIFSFYPTKPVGSIDGGMVVTNDKHVARMLRLYSMNGLTEANNNWDRGSVDIGHKMYMNAIQAYVAQRNLEILDRKQNILTDIMNEYNSAFKLSNTSHHLYRINLKGINQKKFIAKAAENGITAGIHYTPAHLKGVYEKHMNWFNSAERDICTYMGSSTVSIPFNEKLTDAEVKKIIAFVHENAG